MEEVKIMDVPTDWGRVRSIFKNEGSYVTDLIKKIDVEIKNIPESIADLGTPINLEVFIGLLPEMPNPEPDIAIGYIQESFLKFLEFKEVIRNLSIAVKQSTEEDSDYSYVVAHFVLARPSFFVAAAFNLEKVFTENTHTKKIKTFQKKLSVRSGKVYIGTTEIFTGSMGAVFDALYQNRSTEKEGKKIKNGKPLRRAELKKIGRYRNADSFNEALKRMRAIIGKIGLSAYVRIDAFPVNHLQMVIAGPVEE